MADTPDAEMQKEDIDKFIDCLTKPSSDSFEKIDCPKCKNSAIMFSIPKAEWVNFPGKSSQCKRLRFGLECLHCGLKLDSPGDLEQHGIKSEIEI